MECSMVFLVAVALFALLRTILLAKKLRNLDSRVESLRQEMRLKALQEQAETRHQEKKAVEESVASTPVPQAPRLQQELQPPPFLEIEKPDEPVAAHSVQLEKKEPLDAKLPQPSKITATQLARVPKENFVVKLIKQRIDHVRQTTRELGWEVAIGTYWLPRVAIILILIAVVFLMSLLAGEWAPYWRIGWGYATCAALLVLGWKFEKKYDQFARILYAGGLALSYFVTFATWYIPFARLPIFTSAGPTLALLAGVVVVWAVVAQIRKSKVIAFMVTGLGHFTILMATHTLDQPTEYSTAGVLFISIGSAFFLLKNRWYYVASLGLLGSYINHFIILNNGPVPHDAFDFFVAMGILAVYLLTYALSELFSPASLRRKDVPTWFRSTFVTMNTACFFTLGTFIAVNSDFSKDHLEVFWLNYAFVLLVIGVAYLRLRDRDPLYNVYFTKAVAVATLGLASQYSGDSLAAWFAVETVVLLFSSRRSGLVVTRILAYAVGILALGYAVYVGLDTFPAAYASEEYYMHAFLSAFAVLSFFAASQLYQRTNWSIRSPRTVSFAGELRLMCWQLDLVGERSECFATAKKPLNGLLFPYLYAIAGLAVYLTHTRIVVQEGHRFPAIAIFACLMAVLAYVLQSRPFGLASVLAAVVATVVGTYEIAESSVQPHVIWPSIGIIALAVVAVASDWPKSKGPGALSFHRAPASPYILYGIATLLLGILLDTRLDLTHEAIAIMAAGVGLGLLFLVLKPRPLAICSSVLLAWAASRSVPQLTDLIDTAGTEWKMAIYLVTAFCLLGERFYAMNKKRADETICGSALMITAWALVLCYLEETLPAHWLPTGMAAASFAFLAYGLFFRSASAGGVAVIGVVWVSLLSTGKAYVFDAQMSTGLVMGFVLPIVFWVICERLCALYKGRIVEFFGKNYPSTDGEKTLQTIAAILIASSAALSLAILERIPNLSDLNLSIVTISWFALAALLFLASLLIHEKFYRYTGLGIIFLSLIRVFFIDMSEAEAVFRIAAFAVLGIGLLSISFGYFTWRQRLKDKEEAPETNE